MSDALDDRGLIHRGLRGFDPVPAALRSETGF